MAEVGAFILTDEAFPATAKSRIQLKKSELLLEKQFTCGGLWKTALLFS